MKRFDPVVIVQLILYVLCFGGGLLAMRMVVTMLIPPLRLLRVLRKRRLVEEFLSKQLVESEGAPVRACVQASELMTMFRITVDELEYICYTSTYIKIVERWSGGGPQNALVTYMDQKD